MNSLYSGEPTGARSEHWVPSTTSFSIIVHLVIYKLWLESRHFNWISFAMGTFCILIYWCFLLLGQIPTISNFLQPQLLGVTKQMFSSSEFWLMIIGCPLVCLAPDLYIQLTKQVFYPSPIEKVLFEQKFVEPNYDYREHFNKIQKSLQMRKRQAAIQNEQRKIILAQRRSTFSKQEAQLESSLVSIRAEEQLLNDLENPANNKMSKRNLGKVNASG
jgi:magnesium-transporting ATPase (P-type)